jgi:hypothetical protein
MGRRCAKRVLLFFAVSTALPWAAPVRASLGGNEASVMADGAQLRGAVNSVAQLYFDTLEISAETGMRVREYLGRDGVVFAVTWSGPAVPDLRQLLGAHFDEYTAALARLDHPGLRRSVRVASSGLIVETDGHMRAYSGRARLPALVPAGVSPDELR